MATEKARAKPLIKPSTVKISNGHDRITQIYKREKRSLQAAAQRPMSQSPKNPKLQTSHNERQIISLTLRVMDDLPWCRKETVT